MAAKRKPLADLAAAGKKVGTVEVKVFGAWLFEMPYEVRDEHMQQLRETGALEGMRLIHMLPGEHSVEDLPALRQEFKRWLPGVVDPRRYVVTIGFGGSVGSIRMSDVPKTSATEE